MVTLNSNIVTVPGVSITETTAGLIPAALALFRTCYVLGTSTTGDYNTPTQVLNATDFTNQFGSSFSLNPISLFFKNHPYGILYFVRCKAPNISELTVGATVPVGTYSFSLSITGLGSPRTVSITTVTGDTQQDVIDKFITAVNTDTTLVPYVLAYDPTPGNATFRIKALSPSATMTISSETAPATGSLTEAAVVSTSKDDFIFAIDNVFDPDEHEQGFLCAPEAFQTLTSQSDRQAVGISMYNFCERGDYNWMALLDCGPSITTTALAIQEKSLYTPTKGHAAFYYPYVKFIDETGTEVNIPASTGVAGIALRRYAEQGFQEPPAGILYPLAGVTDPVIKIGVQAHAVLNPEGVNAIRRLPNRGVIVYGARTCSSNEYYRFINTRVIFNVIAGTFRTAFDQFIFSAIDGQGILFNRIKQTAEAILYRLWRGKALYGATPTQAYLVVIDERNNLATDLEQGIFRMDVYAVPSPTGERFLINLNRTAIGQIDLIISSLSNSGSTP